MSSILHGIGKAGELAIRFVLEVPGAAGAVWGTSEALGLRDESNNDAWRIAALAIGAFGMIRFVALNCLKKRNIRKVDNSDLKERLLESNPKLQEVLDAHPQLRLSIVEEDDQPEAAS